MEYTTTKPTDRMIRAAEEAFLSFDRRVSSEYTTGTVTGMVVRGMVTPGDREHYLTTRGVQILGESGFDTTRDDREENARQRLNALAAELGVDPLSFSVHFRSADKHYPNRPLHLADGLLTVPAVITATWRCAFCGGAPGDFDSLDSVLWAITQHHRSEHPARV